MRQPRDTHGPSASAKPADFLPHLLELVGQMSVGDFAKLTGITVEELAEIVNGASEVLGHAEEVRTKAGVSDRDPERPIELILAGLVGSATLREVETVVDRWLLGLVMQEHGGNVTHAAARLGISRRRLRERWAATRSARGLHLAGQQGTAAPPSVPFPVPPLSTLVARGAVYADVHEATARWLVACVLEQEGHNVTKTGKLLGISRRLVRELRGESKGNRTRG